jgi:hypothetical protein
LQVAIEDIEVVAGTLGTGGYALDARDELDRIDRELEARGLAMADYRRLRAEAARLAGAVERHAALEVAQREAEQLRRELVFAESEGLRLGRLVREAAEVLQRAAVGAPHAHPASGPHLVVPPDEDAVVLVQGTLDGAP